MSAQKPDGIDLPEQIIYARNVYENSIKTFGKRSKWAIKGNYHLNVARHKVRLN